MSKAKTRLDAVMTRLEATEGAVAMKTGLKPAAVARYRCGESSPRLGVAVMIARALGVRLADAFEFEEEVRRVQTHAASRTGSGIWVVEPGPGLPNVARKAMPRRSDAPVE